MKLGPFEVEHPFILAPMAGITNSPFRRLMRRMNSSVVISELVSATGIEYMGQKTLDLLRFHPEERTIGLQIFGDDPAHLVKACQLVEKLGADFVDLNMGCPVPKVVKRGGGAAMCRDLPALSKTLRLMVDSVKIPVTIKIRTGWDSETRNAVEVSRVAADAGIAWVAIHGRTRAQAYAGDADWEFIGNVKAKSTIPVIGNGDLTTPEKAVERYRTYGVDAVLIGRGALRNPFIFDQAAKVLNGQPYRIPEASDYLEMLDAQRKLLEETYLDRGSMVHARKFLAWYSAGFPGSGEFRKKVFTIPEGPELWSEATRFFEESVAKRDNQYLQEDFLMGGHG
ncbi:MAG: tRNA dihydrouridine synthase DusB [Cryobacterium sp.]|nr:tRNA dihydrouridine synthase DusB [Oligoflexia bacterium]